MKLLILAGGFGTRLKSVVGTVPKALAPVNEKPFLYLQLEHWVEQGITSFVFLLHHQADLIIEFVNSIRQGILQNCEIEYVVEPNPLDTGGAVANAIVELNLSGDFLLTNADTWIGSGVSDLSRGESPSIATVEVSNASRYGRLEFDDFSYIAAFVEKSERSKVGWINAGLSKLSVGFFLPWNGKAFSLESVTFPMLVDEGKVRAIKLETDFIDIGVPEDYLRFCLWVEGGRLGEL